MVIGSTFGGNPLASAVAIAALDVVKEEELVKRYYLWSLLFSCCDKFQFYPLVISVLLFLKHVYPFTQIKEENYRLMYYKYCSYKYMN